MISSNAIRVGIRVANQVISELRHSNSERIEKWETSDKTR